MRQLNYWFVHCRISLDSPQISSFVWESINLLLFFLWSTTQLRVHSITPLPQPPIQPMRPKPEFFKMNQIIIKKYCIGRHHEFILITCAILVEQTVLVNFSFIPIHLYGSLIFLWVVKNVSEKRYQLLKHAIIFFFNLKTNKQPPSKLFFSLNDIL